jgi:general stress protein YciG
MTDTYQGAHNNLKRLRGPASDYDCECGLPAKDWAYQYTGDPELRLENGTKPHSLDPDDYTPMCRSCHNRFDREHDHMMAEKMRDVSRQAGRRVGAIMTKRREADPDNTEKQRERGRRGGMATAERLKTDLEFAESMRENSRRNARMRRQCSECGLESSPGGIGTHQRFTGHEGVTT